MSSVTSAKRKGGKISKSALCVLVKLSPEVIGLSICFGCLSGSKGSKFCTKPVDLEAETPGTCGTKSHVNKFMVQEEALFIPPLGGNYAFKAPFLEVDTIPPTKLGQMLVEHKSYGDWSLFISAL